MNTVSIKLLHVKRSKIVTNHFIDMCLLEGKDIPNAVKIFESIEKGSGQHDTPWNYNTNRNNM